jgi:hypothetical protein
MTRGLRGLIGGLVRNLVDCLVTSLHGLGVGR